MQSFFRENNLELDLEDPAEDSHEDRGLRRSSANGMNGRYSGNHQLKGDDR